MRRFLPLLLVLMLLCGCSQGAASPTEPVIQPSQTAPMRTEPETAEAPAANITVVYEYIAEGGMESARLTGYADDGDPIWVYETERLPVG